MSGSNAYRIGTGVAVLASLLTVWTTIVRDGDNGMSFFLIIMAAAVGAFAAWFRPDGMARTMLGVAAMQALLGVAMATAPVIANTPDGSSRALIFNGVFAILWLVSAAFFRLSVKRNRQIAPAH